MKAGLLARYITVGLITYAVYNLLVSLLYRSTSSALISSSVSYVFAIFFNFIASRTYTFKAKNFSVFAHLSQYLILAAVNFSIVAFSNYFFVDRIGLNVYIVNNITIATTIVVGFVASNYIIFKKKHRIPGSC